MEFKKCSKCRSVKAVDHFNARASSKDGLHPHCKQCVREYRKTYRSRPEVSAHEKEYRESYIESGRLSEVDRVRKKREDVKAKRRAYRSTEDQRARRREYLNRPEIRARVNELRAIRRARYSNDVKYKINNRVSCLIRRSIKTGKNNRSWKEFVDFNIDELKAHLERQFTKGMTWERFMAGEIHIDHIVPISSFDIKEVGDAEFRACWSLANLRPLWAKENLVKQKRALFIC